LTATSCGGRLLRAAVPQQPHREDSLATNRRIAKPPLHWPAPLASPPVYRDRRATPSLAATRARFERSSGNGLELQRGGPRSC